MTHGFLFYDIFSTVVRKKTSLIKDV